MLPGSRADGLRPAPRSSGRLSPFGSQLRSIGNGLANESLLVVCTAVFAGVLLWNLHLQINQDAWLALTAGRAVFEHGLPHHDLLSIWTSGRTWVDQQWLGQLVLFGINALGGLRLLAGVHAALIVSAFAGAVAISRRLGASSRCALYLIPFAFPLLAVSMWQIRTQSLAFPLFVAVIALLALDARAPSRRAYVVLPLLCLWANVHGSVVLGVALTALRGLDLILGGRRLRGATLLIAGPLCLFASPYALQLPGYYRSTLLNPGFRVLVSEWLPTTLSVATMSFFVLLVGTGWLLGRAHTALTRFEWLALAVTGLAGLDAVRNVGYFALAALMLLPTALDKAWPARPGKAGRWPDAVVAVTALAAVAIMAMKVLGYGAGALVGFNDPAAAAAVAKAVREAPGRKVFADVHYADWLIWEQPSLSGRIAFDARFELLSRRQLAKVATFNNPGRSWRTTSAGYAVLVLDRTDDGVAVEALSRDPSAMVLFSNPQLVVFQRRGLSAAAHG